MSAIWIEIADARGSTPRDAGTVMKVTKQGEKGTIGGGRLEYEAAREARKLLQSELREDVVRTFALGPNLGQCCGGSVTLRFTRDKRDFSLRKSTNLVPYKAPTSPMKLWLWGAGHVGRAVVALAPRSAFDIVWVDTALDRFPCDVPDHASKLLASEPTRLVSRSPVDAHHLIFTYSHDLDFALCAALLRKETASIGLIGSDTKRARFFRRLRDIGLDPTPIVCPIGDKSLGKHPDMIAQGVINGFLMEHLS